MPCLPIKMGNAIGIVIQYTHMSGRISAVNRKYNSIRPIRIYSMMGINCFMDQWLSIIVKITVE